MTIKKKTIKAWAVIHQSMMTPASAGYAYSVYPKEKYAKEIASCWTLTSGRRYKVVLCTITY